MRLSRNLASMILAAGLAVSWPVAWADSGEDFFEGVRLFRAQQYEDAAAWFRKAAEKGDGDAQFLLGRMYYDGNSIAVDYVEALMWFDVADSSGVRVAARYRDGLSARMNAEDVAEARRRAEAWHRQHPPVER